MAKGRRDIVTVGLTGGIGAGKSTALAMFAELGALTFSADQAVHELYETEECRTALVGRFGSEVLAENGEVDRRRLAAAVRGRPEELRWLEKLTHPRVRERLRAFIGAAPADSVVVCEVPLLFEAGYEDEFDLIVTIEASSEVRRARSPHEFGPEVFAELEALQVSSERRQQGSQLVFVNDGSAEELRRFVQEAYRRAEGLFAREEQR